MNGTTKGAMALTLPTAELTPAMQAYFKKCEDRLGFVPNVLHAYAHDMAKLEAFVALSFDLMQGPSGLTKLEREMIAVAVSSENHCFYCLAAHGAQVRVLSGDAKFGEMMVMNYRAAHLPPRHLARRDFAVKMTKASSTIVEADRHTLREQGFAERDIWDIAAVAGFYNMTNRLASALDMRPNDDYHKMGR